MLLWNIIKFLDASDLYEADSGVCGVYLGDDECYGVETCL
jgi:hypothetical protein